MKDIKIIQGEDWVGLYVDDKLAMEGHSLHTLDLIELLTGTKVQSYDAEGEKGEDLFDRWDWRCPKEFPYEDFYNCPEPTVFGPEGESVCL